MKEIHCVTESGESFSLFKKEDGYHVCPVCGSDELESPAYSADGLPSFQMCSCGFEYGFDDSSASPQAVVGIEENWKRWRLKVIKRSSYLKSTLNKCEKNLRNIGVELAFDLMPVSVDRAHNKD